ncbi:probable serine/threonine-protein kinase clkA [Musca vetustissima]|uniref:probable serine/threonine-protein kinase clkA n=1 Tax=Musca vetustissima TaxID=27455 RepID=UPI002AB6C6B9|nr:probable serine/threonine-protein kinase clkA [Musca vetustissima]
MSKPVQTPRDMDSRQFGDGNYYRDQKDHDNDLFRRREDNNSNRNRRTANDQDFQRRSDFNTHKEAQCNNNQDFSRRGDDNCRYDSATSYHEERRRRDEARQFSSGDNDMNRNDYNNERRGGGGGGNRFNSNTDDRGPPPHNQSSWNDDNRSRSRSRSDMNRNDYNNERRGGGGGGGNRFNSNNDDRGPPLHNQSSYNDENRSRSRSRNDMYRNDYNNERRGGNCFNSNNDVRGPPPHNQSSYNDVNRSRNEPEFENTNLFARRENVPQDTRSRHQEDAPRNYGGDFGTNYQNNQGFEGQHTRNYSPQQFGGDFGTKYPNNQGFEGQQNMNYSSQQYGKKTEFDNYTNFRNNSDFGYNNPPPAAGTFQGSTHGGFQDTNIGYFPRNNDFGGNTFMNSTNSFNQPPPASPPGPTNFDGPPPPGGFGYNHFGYNLPQNNFGNSPQPPFTPDNISGNFPGGSGVVGVGPRNSWTANPQDFKQQNNSMNFNNKRGRSRDNSMGDGRAISPGNNERKLSGPPPNKNKDKNKKNKKNKKIKKELKQQQKNNQNTTPQQENEATNDETTTNKKGKLRGRKKNKDVNFLRRRRQANVLKDEAQRLEDAGILKKPPKNLSKCEPELYWTKWWPKYAYIENVIPRFSENEDGIKEFINFNYEPESQKLEIRKKLLLRIGCAKISRTLDINEINYPLRDVYKLFVYRKHLMDPNFHKHLTFHELHRVKFYTSLA